MELSADMSDDPTRYDRLVPGSRGMENFRQVHVVKYRHGFRPPSITWVLHPNTDWGWKGLQFLMGPGCDNALATSNIQVHRLLMRFAVDSLSRALQAFILGQKALALQLAATFDVLLMCYRDHQPRHGNLIAGSDSAARSSDLLAAKRDDESLPGVVWLVDLYDRCGLQEYELQQCLRAVLVDLDPTSDEVHYLGS